MITSRPLAAGLLCVILTSCSGEADFSDAIETGTPDAETYRAEILEIDRLVFADEKVDDARREALASRLDALAKRVAGEKPEKFMKLESFELRALSKQALRAGSARSMSNLQNQWMRLRNNLFDDRWWFARSAADLEATATPSAATVPQSETSEPQRITASPEIVEFPGRVTPDSFDPLPAPGDPGVPEGRWSVEAIFADGAPRSDPEMSGSEWLFEDGTLSMINVAATERFSFESEGESLHVRMLDPSGSGAREGWMLLRRRGSIMHAAFLDNLSGRPSGFVPEPGNSELLIVVVLRRR